MSKFNTIIAIDPSGNFHNGLGGTGFARYSNHDFNDFTIWAKEHATKEDYYNVIKGYIELPYKFANGDVLLVVEDFRLQRGKASAQSNQTMETSELIGKIEEWCKEFGITCVRQQNTIKARWKDDLLKKELEELGYRGKYSSRHSKDALRHLLHAIYFTQKKVGNNDK